MAFAVRAVFVIKPLLVMYQHPALLWPGFLKRKRATGWLTFYRSVCEPDLSLFSLDSIRTWLAAERACGLLIGSRLTPTCKSLVYR
jgi:hypothetical protein